MASRFVLRTLPKTRFLAVLVSPIRRIPCINIEHYRLQHVDDAFIRPLMAFSHRLCCKVSSFLSVQTTSVSSRSREIQGGCCQAFCIRMFRPQPTLSIGHNKVLRLFVNGPLSSGSFMRWCQCIIQTSDTSKDFSPGLVFMPPLHPRQSFLVT